MRRRVTECKFPVFALGLALLLPGADALAALRISVERVRLGPASADSLRLELGEGDDGTMTLAANLGRIDSGLGWRFSGAAWQCRLQHENGGWSCAGPLRAGGRRAELAAALDGDQTRLSLAQGRAQVIVRHDGGQPDHLALTLRQVPVGWAQPFLATLWATAQPQQGRIDGEIGVEFPEQGDLRTRARLRATDIGLDTPDGRLAAAGLSGALDLDYRARGALGHIDLALKLERGELLSGSNYIVLGDTPVEASLQVHGRPGGGWDVPAFFWRDGATLEASGSARLDADAAPEQYRVEANSGDLAVLAARYLSGPLGLAGLADLALSGGLALVLEGDAGGLGELTLAPRRVEIDDGAGRFAITGLDGRVRWTAGAAEVESRVSWAGAALHGMVLGPAEFAVASRDRGIRVQSPVELAWLGGRLILEDFRIAPAGSDSDARARLGLSVIDVDLGELSRALGWPPFEGRLSGRLPSARYLDQRLTFDGGLSMQLFDGTLAIRHLEMERPFGVAPSLAADIDFAGLDLEPLTEVFGFGAITGRLNGRIHGLRLLDWTPAAFDAELLSDPGYRGRRRISQRAVQDISSLGGSGFIAGIQGRILRVFSSFRYSRLGLSCRLANDVCEMDGIGSAGDGYTIVKGAGLPRIEVVGFRRWVDWPLLVERLKVATEGQGPVIE